MIFSNFPSENLWGKVAEYLLILIEEKAMAMDKEENNKPEVPEPFKSDNPKAKMTNQQKIWLIVFSIIAAALYTYINIS